MSLRQRKVEELIRESAGRYIAEESNRTSLITVTHADIAPNFRNATVYISVYPTDKEEEALTYLRRSLPKLRARLAEDLSMKILPFLRVELDLGEKNRQRIDEISNH